jgi:GTP cyclohydrolase II
VADSHLNTTSFLFGSPDRVAVERSLAEFGSGRPVIIASACRTAALPVDGITDELLAAFRRFCAPEEPYLIVTSRRARALGLDAVGATGLSIAPRDDAEAILALAADADIQRDLKVCAAGANADAAIELAKLAQRLPALLVADVTAKAADAFTSLVQVRAGAVAEFRKAAVMSLAVAAEADVPLNGELSAHFVIFRDALGGSSTAVIVGKPDLTRPVPVRLHSACLTGDVFGSRRCDCGDQLRLSLRRLDEAGGGIILYLDQEGRGLGLANKMRTYQLQDTGLDTVDANTTLGFHDDERDYGVAGRMLELLGCMRVRLLTNNPAKLDGLIQTGVEVCGRIPLHGPVNADNFRYLSAKATRAGHKLEYLLAGLAEPAPVAETVGGDPTS